MSGTLSILLVEDEPDIAAVMKLALEELGGFRVTVCGTGAMALEQAAGENYDLLLLDVMLPDMDGTAVLRELRRERGAELPVVFVTARVRPGEEDRLRGFGALDVISKPFDPMVLPERIHALMTEFKKS